MESPQQNGPSDSSRRKFLRRLGFGVAGIGAAALGINEVGKRAYSIAESVGTTMDEMTAINTKLPTNIEVDRPRKRKKPYEDKKIEYSTTVTTPAKTTRRADGTIQIDFGFSIMQAAYSKYILKPCHYKIVGETVITPGDGEPQEYAAICIPNSSTTSKHHLIGVGYTTGTVYVLFDNEEWEPISTLGKNQSIFQIKKHWEEFTSELEQPSIEDDVVARLTRRDNAVRLMQKYNAPYPYVESTVEMPKMARMDFTDKPFSETPEEAKKWENRKTHFLTEQGFVVIDPGHVMGAVMRTKFLVNKLKDLIKEGKADQDNVIQLDEFYHFTYVVEAGKLNEETLYPIAYGLLLDNSVISEGISQSIPTEIAETVLKYLNVVTAMTPEDMYSNQLGITHAINELANGEDADHLKVLSDIVDAYGVAKKGELPKNTPQGIFHFIPIVFDKAHADDIAAPKFQVSPRTNGWRRRDVAVAEVVLKLLANTNCQKKVIEKIASIGKKFSGN